MSFTLRCVLDVEAVSLDVYLCSLTVFSCTQSLPDLSSQCSSVYKANKFAIVDLRAITQILIEIPVRRLSLKDCLQISFFPVTKPFDLDMHPNGI